MMRAMIVLGLFALAVALLQGCTGPLGSVEGRGMTAGKLGAGGERTMLDNLLPGSSLIPNACGVKIWEVPRGLALQIIAPDCAIHLQTALEATVDDDKARPQVPVPEEPDPARDQQGAVDSQRPAGRADQRGGGKAG